jgi:tRNA(Ile)-lysidine synthase
MLERVQNTIRGYGMFAPGASLGVAVSGGADSVCLLDILCALRPLWRLRLTVLHLNHGLRGAESDDDAAFVVDLAREYDLPVQVEKVSVGATAGNLEEVGRKARRDLFRRVLASGAVSRVATGHTRSDQAETVLFRLLRGAYTTGLRGILPVTAEGLVRPLLDCTRDEVLAWLGERKLRWREDSTNADPAFARNRIRRELLPQLTANWNPQLPEILANHARLAREDDDYWSGLIGQPEPVNGCIVIDLSSIHSHPAVRRRLIRQLILRTKGDLRGIDFRHIEQIMQLMTSAEGHNRVQVPGVDVLRSFNWARFAKPLTAPAERNWSALAEPPAVIPIPGGTEIVLEYVDPAAPAEAHDTLEIVGLDPQLFSSRAACLEVRNWRPGDRIRQIGHAHEEKVKTLFNEARVPLWDRRNWPIICVDGQLVWARGFGADARYAASETSDWILRISERKRI